jgi:hypothetical protein
MHVCGTRLMIHSENTLYVLAMESVHNVESRDSTLQQALLMTAYSSACHLEPSQSPDDACHVLSFQHLVQANFLCPVTHWRHSDANVPEQVPVLCG